MCLIANADLSLLQVQSLLEVLPARLTDDVLEELRIIKL